MITARTIHQARATPVERTKFRMRAMTAASATASERARPQTSTMKNVRARATMSTFSAARFHDYRRAALVALWLFMTLESAAVLGVVALDSLTPWPTVGREAEVTVRVETREPRRRRSRTWWPPEGGRPR